ncbi:MAG: hypothetical protein ACU84J_00365 [Gammaproteobacteria bacterium]
MKSLILKVLVGLAGCFFAANIYAGDYDGIWVIEGSPDFHVVSQQNDRIIIGNLWGGLDGWDAVWGPLVGNSAELETIVNPDGDVVRATVVFNPDKVTATLTIHSCQLCGYPLEVPVPVKMIWGPALE